jgi:hypothetical protein
MLFCQLGRADSLREICNGLGCCLGRLVHVGIAKAPCRSTLSYANEHRPAALFEDLFFTSLARFRDQQGLGARQHVGNHLKTQFSELCRKASDIIAPKAQSSVRSSPPSLAKRLSCVEAGNRGNPAVGAAGFRVRQPFDR